MNRAKSGLFLLPLVLFGSLSCSVPSTRHSLMSGGTDRDYRVYVPPSLPPGPSAIVLVFHGGGGSGRGTERMTGWDALADREGFIVVYPDAVGRNWNDGRMCEEIESQRDHVDDVAFVEALLDRLAAERPIDPDRVFATGISNGAIFSHMLAHRLPHRIAAIAPVVGGMATLVAGSEFRGPPVSVFIIQGTDDPLVPYFGGEIARGRGTIIDTVACAKLWAKRNGLAEESVTAAADEGTDVEDGCRTERRVWAGEGEVRLWTIVGGGHTWPGGPQYLPKSLIGTVCRDFDGAEVIWEFFEGHGRKAR